MEMHGGRRDEHKPGAIGKRFLAILRLALLIVQIFLQLFAHGHVREYSLVLIRARTTEEVEEEGSAEESGRSNEERERKAVRGLGGKEEERDGGELEREAKSSRGK